MNSPLVSIIIPVFNREDFIEETLDSVKNQSYKNWECILVDDNSTDNSIGVIERFCKKDNRFQLYVKSKTSKKNASASRNLGLKKAKGTYIQFLDSDDILSENKIDSQVDALKAENEYSLATCKWGILKSNGYFEMKKEGKDYKDFSDIEFYFSIIGKYGGFFPPHVFLVHKKIIDTAGFWNENLTMNDDGEFFFRVFITCKKIKFVPTTYVKYRETSNDNLSTLNSIKKAKSLILSWQIIENYYNSKFTNSGYILEKKERVYFTIKEKYPNLIKENKGFFLKQIKKDNIFLRLKKIPKRIRAKIKHVIRK